MDAKPTAPANNMGTPMQLSSGSGGPSPTGSSNQSPIIGPPTSRDQITMMPATAQTNFPPSAAPATAPPPFVPTGSITLEPTATPSAALNPRSCVTCRRRKVRCDKYMPCGNCRKAHIQCVFPAPGRAPRRPRIKDPNAPPKQSSEREIELMKRLRKLEGIVEDLSGQIEFENVRNPSSSGSPEATADNASTYSNNNINAVAASDSDKRKTQSSNSHSTGSPIDASRPNRPTPSDERPPNSLLRSPTGETQRELGRLVLHERGKSRYISNAFWTKLNDEINELRAETETLTDNESEVSDDEPSPGRSVHHTYGEAGDHHGFVLGYMSSDVDLSKLHPLPSQIPFVWQVYCENVDPLVKILHVPTMSKIIRNWRDNMNNLSPGMEALMFSIYYASITSLEEDEVRLNFGEEKTTLINRFRFAAEQGLAKANFLTSQELVVVQAFALFLVPVRRYDNTRFSWTLTALLVRIGQSLGLHREGTHFAQLKPFDVEMRRRLWWVLCLLDMRSAEEQGTELIISERIHDTRLPLNVNDSDLDPDMTDFPEERQGATDMSFSLVRYEVCTFARSMHMAASATSTCCPDLQTTAQEKEQALKAVYDRVERKYLKGTSNKETNLLHWVASLIGRLIMAKLGLVIYQPIFMSRGGQVLSQDVRDRLFMSCIEVMEYNKILNGEPKCRQWRWLFQTYTQWHAVAYLLIEIRRRPWAPTLERAWVALNETFRDTEPVEYAKLMKNSAAWVPLRKLMVRAEHHREAELARLRDDPQAAEELDLDEMNMRIPSSFDQLPSNLRSMVAQDRWRTLVGREKFNKPKMGRYEDTNFTPPRRATSTPGDPQHQPQPPNPNPQQLGVGQSDPQNPYTDQVMQDRPYNAQEFFSAAFPGAGLNSSNSNEIAQRVFFSAMEQPQPPPQYPSPNPDTQGKPPSRIPTGGVESPGVYNTPAATTGVPSNTLASQDDNLPPWLWGQDMWGPGNLGSRATGGTAVSAGAAMNDVDVNMDEDINWRNWQESIRGLEMDTGMGTFMGTL